MIEIFRRTYVNIALGGIGIVLVGISVSRLIYPYDVGHYEACIWTPALLSINGQNPYAVATQSPFVMAPYGYLYYLTIGLGLKLFGYQLWFGRALSFISAFVCWFCVGRIALYLTKSHQAMRLAQLALLSAFALQAWITIQRPDFPAFALAFTALYLVIAQDNNVSDRVTIKSILVIILLASAFFFKQTALLPVFVAVIFYWQKGYPYLAGYTFAGSIMAIIFVAIILNQTSNGGYYWQHFVLAKSIPYSYYASLQMAINLIKTPSAMVFSVLILVVLFYQCKKSLPDWKKRRFFKRKFIEIVKSPKMASFCYFVIAFTSGFVTSARSGANINYYLEASLVGSIIVCVAWSSIDKHQVRIIAYVCCVFLFALTGLFQLMRIARGEYFRWKSFSYYTEVVTALSDYTPQGAVCLGVYPELVIQAGHNYHFGDWIQYVDGRSPELEKIFRKAVYESRYPAIIWSSKNARDLFPDYRLVPMATPEPEKFYPVYLYIHNSIRKRSLE